MKKFFLTLILAAFCGMSSAFAYDFSAVCPTGQTLYYNIIDAVNHEVEIVCPGEGNNWNWSGFDRPSGYIDLPTSVENDGINYAVTAIGDYAFRDCRGLTGDLIIPNSIVSIGDFAFNGSYDYYNAGNLVIGNSVISIGKLAFYDSRFGGSLTIGNSVVSIGEAAFASCEFTGDLVIPDSVVLIEDLAFNNCSGFHGNLVIGNSVTSIGNSAFQSCGFSGVLVIPDSVISLGDYAFHDCINFTGDLVIPNSVTRIGTAAFEDDWGFNGHVVIGNSVVEIGDLAFSCCFHITGDLIIPNSVTTIGRAAFDFCWLYSKEEQTTANLYIGSSVTSIGESAFKACYGLTSITVYCDVPPVTGFDAFESVSNTIPVYVPCGSKQAYQTAEEWNQFTNFRQMPYYEFTVEVAEPMTGTVDILQEPDCETEGIVLAVAENDFEFQNWETVEGVFVSDENPYNFTLTEDLHLVARFFNNVGVNDNETPEITLYPNPTNGIFIVKGEGLNKIEVYNTTGQHVITRTVSDDFAEIDLSNAANGLYLVRIMSGAGVTERTVVKR